MSKEKGILCKGCGSYEWKVYDIRPMGEIGKDGCIMRRRRCKKCGKIRKTTEN